MAYQSVHPSVAMHQKTNILLLALILVALSSDVRARGEGSQVLRFGIWDAAGHRVEEQVFRELREIVLGSESEEEALRLALDAGFEGVRFPDQSWQETREDFDKPTYTSFHKTGAFGFTSGSTVKLAAKAVGEAWEECLASEGLKAWIHETEDPRLFWVGLAWHDTGGADTTRVTIEATNAGPVVPHGSIAVSAETTGLLYRRVATGNELRDLEPVAIRVHGSQVDSREPLRLPATTFLHPFDMPELYVTVVLDELLPLPGCDLSAWAITEVTLLGDAPLVDLRDRIHAIETWTSHDGRDVRVLFDGKVELLEGADWWAPDVDARSRSDRTLTVILKEPVRITGVRIHQPVGTHQIEAPHSICRAGARSFFVETSSGRVGGHESGHDCPEMYVHLPSLWSLGQTAVRTVRELLRR